MQSTGGKPSMPGNWLWMSRGVECEQWLRRYAFAAFRDLGIRLKDDDGVISNLLQKVAFNAQAISELSWAGDFYDELEDQARQMGKWLNPPDEQQLATSDPYLTMESLQRALLSRGHDVPEGTIWSWKSRGKVDTKTRRDTGKTAYRLADVLALLTRDTK